MESQFPDALKSHAGTFFFILMRVSGLICITLLVQRTSYSPQAQVWSKPSHWARVDGLTLRVPVGIWTWDVITLMPQPPSHPIGDKSCLHLNVHVCQEPLCISAKFCCHYSNIILSYGPTRTTRSSKCKNCLVETLSNSLDVFLLSKPIILSVVQVHRSKFIFHIWDAKGDEGLFIIFFHVSICYFHSIGVSLISSISWS